MFWLANLPIASTSRSVHSPKSQILMFFCVESINKFPGLISRCKTAGRHPCKHASPSASCIHHLSAFSRGGFQLASERRHSAYCSAMSVPSTYSYTPISMWSLSKHAPRNWQIFGCTGNLDDIAISCIRSLYVLSLFRGCNPKRHVSAREVSPLPKVTRCRLIATDVPRHSPR